MTTQMYGVVTRRFINALKMAEKSEICLSKQYRRVVTNNSAEWSAGSVLAHQTGCRGRIQALKELNHVTTSGTAIMDQKGRRDGVEYISHDTWNVEALSSNAISIRKGGMMKDAWQIARCRS